jgi:hypothetical protein
MPVLRGNQVILLAEGCCFIAATTNDLLRSRFGKHRSLHQMGWLPAIRGSVGGNGRGASPYTTIFLTYRRGNPHESQRKTLSHDLAKRK